MVRLVMSTLAPMVVRNWRTAREAPPAPSTSAGLPFTSTLWCSNVRCTPMTSVFLPTSLPPSLITVFTAPIPSATASTLSRSGRMPSLCGMVTLKPRIPRASTTSRRSSSSSTIVTHLRYVPRTAEAL